jgi:hypothetical protein
MVGLIFIVVILFVHFIMDFIAQTDDMALNKSKSIKWLSIHVGVYIIPFWIAFGWKYGLVNFLLHWITDFVSSKLTTKYYLEMEYAKAHRLHSSSRQKFWIVIGADQFIHAACLILTLGI